MNGTHALSVVITSYGRQTMKIVLLVIR